MDVFNDTCIDPDMAPTVVVRGPLISFNNSEAVEIPIGELIKFNNDDGKLEIVVQDQKKKKKKKQVKSEDDLRELNDNASDFYSELDDGTPIYRQQFKFDDCKNLAFSVKNVKYVQVEYIADSDLKDNRINAMLALKMPKGKGYSDVVKQFNPEGVQLVDQQVESWLWIAIPARAEPGGKISITGSYEVDVSQGLECKHLELELIGVSRIVDDDGKRTKLPLRYVTLKSLFISSACDIELASVTIVQALRCTFFDQKDKEGEEENRRPLAYSIRHCNFLDADFHVGTDMTNSSIVINAIKTFSRLDVTGFYSTKMEDVESGIHSIFIGGSRKVELDRISKVNSLVVSKSVTPVDYLDGMMPKKPFSGRVIDRKLYTNSVSIRDCEDVEFIHVNYPHEDLHCEVSECSTVREVETTMSGFLLLENMNDLMKVTLTDCYTTPRVYGEFQLSNISNVDKLTIKSTEGHGVTVPLTSKPELHKRAILKMDEIFTSNSDLPDYPINIGYGFDKIEIDDSEFNHGTKIGPCQELKLESTTNYNRDVPLQVQVEKSLTINSKCMFPRLECPKTCTIRFDGTFENANGIVFQHFDQDDKSIICHVEKDFMDEANEQEEEEE